MKNKPIFKRRLIILTVLIILTATSFLMNFPTNLSTTEMIGEDNKDINEKKEIITVESPSSSTLGEDEWWNSSFFYRKLINITNPYSISLTNHIVSITFNYTIYVNARKMNSSLKDVRIVENGVLRNYFIQKDYPNQTLATVWFETNLTGGIGHIDQDTYMYYGNNSVNKAWNRYNVNNRFGFLWWRLDEGTGLSANDTIGNKNGILSDASPPLGGPAWVFGKVDKALSFNRANSEKVRVSSFSIGNTYVVSAWLKWGGGTDSQMPWGMSIDTTYNRAILDFFWYNGYLYNNVYDSESSPFLYANGTKIRHTSDTSTWHHYVVENIYGPPQIARLWIDGVLKGTATYKNPTATNKIFQLSCNPSDDGYHWNGQIDDVKVYNYALTDKEVAYLYDRSIILTALNEEVERAAEVRIIVRDIDGRIVPNAEVSLVNATNSILFTENSTEDGIATFEKIPYGFYNITVNYSLSLGSEAIIYNSSETGESIEFKGLLEIKTIYVYIWTIDFEIVDWDHEIMNHGYILVYKDDTKAEPLANLTINAGTGTQTFRWLNASSYYYEVHYKNEDYKYSDVLINSSTIVRTSKLKTDLFYVNNSAIGSFYVKKYVWAENSNSSYVGQTRIINATIELKNMTNHLTRLDVSYRNIAQQDIKITEASKNYTYQTQDTIKFTVLDDYDAYGLNIEVYGYNSTKCNGTIEVKLTQTTHQYIIVNMSKLQIKVIASNGAAVPGVIVRVFNGTVFKGIGIDVYNYSNSVINLTIDSNGYAHGEINTDLEFWYLRGTYNYSLEFFEAVKYFDVNYTNPGQWNATYTKAYNYTVNQASTIILEIKIDTSKFMTNFSYVQGDSEIFWGQNMSFQVNFSYITEELLDWAPLTDPDQIVCTVYQWGNPPISLLSISMDKRGINNFIATINSSLFSAEPSGSTYIVIVSGSKSGYSDPYDAIFPIKIKALITDASVHNYVDSLAILTDKTVSQYYNELINITTSYYLYGNPNSRLTGAELSYNWDYDSGTNIGEDPIHPGYYTFEINTSSAPSTATYGIDISISLENHTTKSFVAYLDILPRTTRLNGTTTLLHNSTIIWINDSYTWIYKYVDTDTGNTIGNLESAFYYWYKIDAEGKPIGKTSANIDLANATGNVYVLDFNTENREVGSYALFITFQKNNYQARNAFIDLTIEYRTFRASLTATGKEGLIITRVKGQPIVLSLTLTDLSKSSSASSGGTVATQAAAALTKATVKLSIAGLGKTYKFTEVKSGVYNLTIETTDPAYQAFFAPQTLVANITIEKENYVTQVIDITIVVDMDQWIPGFPAFYLLMIIIGVGAVVGSLVTYRYIQLAKIPRFVKFARAMKKSIKLSEPISESLVYPSKKEYMAKFLGKRFDVLGVSLDTVLGIERKKIEIKPEIKEGYKESLEKKLKSFVKKKERKPESAEDINDSKGGVA